MAQETTVKYRRRPVAAVVLSLIMPGLGHVYCGRIVKGLILGFLSAIGVPIVLLALRADFAPARIAIIAISWLGSLAIGLIAVIDSYYVARHSKVDYELKDYNRWYVYLLLVVTGTGGAIDVAFEVRDNYYEAFVVPTVSMYPTVFPGDRLLANKTAYKNADPQIGDLVVFPFPDNRNDNFIKRVVALPGDTVEIKKGELYVNGHKLKREKIKDSPLATLKPQMNGEVFYEFNGQAKYRIILVLPKESQKTLPADFAQITVPKHHCFVLGDNRNHSTDSRVFGPIPIVGIKGRFDYLYFPAERWSRFGRIE